MSYTLRTKRRDYDLGPTFEFLMFCRELGRVIDKGSESNFAHLLGLVNLNERILMAGEVQALREEAQDALSRFAGKWSEHAGWILDTLALLRI